MRMISVMGALVMGALVTGALALTTAAVAQSPPLKIIKAGEPFDDVKQNVEDAVISAAS